MKTNWRLPRGVDELLPPHAWELETLRRRVLDLFVTWGYAYLEPPVIEYLDALLVGSGEDLDLQTLKVVDQVSGRQLGVRADMTSQAVRVDAHSLPGEGVQRFCYVGPVVFANPQIAQTSRVPIKAGAELFGAAGVRGDAEVVNLMLAAVDAAGVSQPVLLLGHMGIYRSLVAALPASDALETSALFAAIQRKSTADIEHILAQAGVLDSPFARMLIELPMLMGDQESVGTVRRALSKAPPAVAEALDALDELISLVSESNPAVSVRIDVAELSGYGYHNGPVFAVYHPEHGSALAQGGRYDNIGEAFDRPRPATGFDMNLKAFVADLAHESELIFAPLVANALTASWWAEVQRLRAEGRQVITALSADELPPSGCKLVLQSDGSAEMAWQLVPHTTT